MEKFKITLKETEIEIPLDSVKELVKYLEMDEIVDSLTENNKIESLIERLCMDHSESMAQLLADFFNHKNDDTKDLMTEEQKDLQGDYEIYLSNRYKNL